MELNLERDTGIGISPLTVYSFILLPMPSRLRLDIIIASLGQLALS
jgi:hypothetical protein